MAIFDSDLSVFTRPAVTAKEAGDEVSVRAKAVLPSSLTTSDVVRMVKLPAGYILSDVKLIADDLDSGGTPAITLTVGLMGLSDTAQSSGTELLTASTIAQAGGMASATSGLTQGPFTVDKFIIVTVAHAATTAVAGNLYMIASYFSY